MISSKPLRFVCGLIGLLLTIVTVSLTYDFGKTISQGYAFALAAVAFISTTFLAVLIEISRSNHPWRKGFLAFGFVVGGMCVFADVLTNISTAGVHRKLDVDGAAFSQVSHGDIRKSITNYEAAIERHAAEAVRLGKDLDALVQTKVGDWAVATRPSSPGELDAAIIAKEKEIENESARQGCKTKCEARMKELAHLKQLRGIALSIEKNNAEHQQALNSLSAAQAQAAAAKPKQSAAAIQNLRLAQFAEFSLNPSNTTQQWVDMGMMTYFGVLLTLCAMFFNAMGLTSGTELLSFGGGHEVGVAAPVAPQPSPSIVPMVAALQPAVAPVAPLRHTALPQAPESTNPVGDLQARLQTATRTIVKHVDDRSVAQGLASLLQDYKQKRMQAAA